MIYQLKELKHMRFAIDRLNCGRSKNVGIQGLRKIGLQSLNTNLFCFLCVPSSLSAFEVLVQSSRHLGCSTHFLL